MKKEIIISEVDVQADTETATTDLTVANQHGEPTRLVFANVKDAVKKVTREEAEKDQSALKTIDEMDFSDAISESSNYWECDKGDEIKGVFKGWMPISKTEGNETKYLAVAMLKTSSGMQLLGQTILVEAFQKIPIDAAVKVVCLGKKGRMKLFDVKWKALQAA